jgi:hypothetical protein
MINWLMQFYLGLLVNCYEFLYLSIGRVDVNQALEAKCNCLYDESMRFLIRLSSTYGLPLFSYGFMLCSIYHRASLMFTPVIPGIHNRLAARIVLKN